MKLFQLKILEEDLWKPKCTKTRLIADKCEPWISQKQVVKCDRKWWLQKDACTQQFFKKVSKYILQFVFPLAYSFFNQEISDETFADLSCTLGGARAEWWPNFVSSYLAVIVDSMICLWKYALENKSWYIRMSL